MKLTITDRNKYIKKCDVSQLPIEYSNTKKVELFGKQIELFDDPWMWHLHLKCTDVCNANCRFCVEKVHRNDIGNSEHFLENTDRMLTEMENNGILFSVSVTGGEPLLFNRFDKLVDILKMHKIKFLTINTNGTLLESKLSKLDGVFNVLDISRHGFSDAENNEIFCTTVPTINELQQLRNRLEKTKMRIQCVAERLNSVEDMLKFIDVYKFADDISIRRLMKLGEEYDQNYVINDDIYTEFLDFAFKNWEFKEQTIQDYYVYEIYNTGKKDITFSYSNMDMLREVEKLESDNFIREFIIHPNGCVSGSWGMDNKILLT